MGHLFARPEPREVFADLVEGLLSDLGRKNGWTMADRAGHATPHRIQKFLGEASWDADALLSEVQDYIDTRLGDEQATLVLDDTQVIKKGTRSVGVAHQHCGSTGDVRNCQVMVMLTYAAEAGHTFYDRRLYLPAAWAGDLPRRRDAGVPEEVGFATKPGLGIAMLQAALARKVPFAWVAADADYGKDPALRAFLHAHAVSYVLAVPVTLPLAGPPGKPRQPAVTCAGDLPHYAAGRDQWERRSQGEGSKGQRYYDWTWFEVALPGQDPAEGFAHHLLIRRSTAKKQHAGGRIDFEYAYFLVHHRGEAALPEAVRRAGVRWKIEENNETAKQITGLGHYQVRRWNSWHRHVTCSMLALAFLTVQRAHHPEPEPDAVPHETPEQADEAGKARQPEEGSPCR
ncbi:IS701 family transposase [Streptomyces roseicoloratus]|uniref:IS701 family transposase n=1 Tax=Streptomyces roseicoloratus TaxID=2508722 RepID=A0ABY9S4B8_9ACTN|nr:IS701 family transposase [Streptomyces roseicoloratus]WMX48773.1 IS701 family transposase [Streptomyces roseicoloratus]